MELSEYSFTSRSTHNRSGKTTVDLAEWCQGEYEEFWTVLKGCTGFEQMENESEWDDRLTLQVYLKGNNGMCDCVLCTARTGRRFAEQEMYIVLAKVSAISFTCLSLIHI